MNAMFTSPGVVSWDNGLWISESFWCNDGCFIRCLWESWKWFIKECCQDGHLLVECSRLIQHILTGTPRRPLKLEAYWFATFDENNKSHKYKKPFGLFFADKRPQFWLRGSLKGPGAVYADNSTSFTSLEWHIRIVFFMAFGTCVKKRKRKDPSCWFLVLT